MPYNVAYSDEVIIPQAIEPSALHKQKGSLFGSLQTDDIILIAVILLLLSDPESDKLTLIILGFLFLAGTDLI